MKPSQKWNTRYAREGAEWTTRPPNRFLVEQQQLLPTSGLALDAGAGVGNNSVFLANHGLHVIALDVSVVGLGFLRHRAVENSLSIDCAAMNLAQPWLPSDTFDVIINFNFLERALFAEYRKALKVGGILLFSTFVQPTPDAPRESFFLKPKELLTAFSEFEVLHSSQNSYFHQRSGTTRWVENFVGRKS